MQRVSVTHFSDPGCPWAYSESPVLAALRWRYGDQLSWRLVMIGLSETPKRADLGCTPLRTARAYRSYRRFGMPFSVAPKTRTAATSRACRAIVAARLQDSALGDRAFRALQLMQFATTRLLDDDDALRDTLREVPGLDADAIVASLDDPAIIEAYEADRALARTAAGSPTEWLGKAAQTDGQVRYTAPSLIFEHNDVRLEAGGFQPIEAYEVILANFRAGLERRPAPEDPLDALEQEPSGLTTAEVAEVMRSDPWPANRDAAEEALMATAADGKVVRLRVGDDAVWLAARHAAERAEVRGSAAPAVGTL